MSSLVLFIHANKVKTRFSRAVVRRLFFLRICIISLARGVLLENGMSVDFSRKLEQRILLEHFSS